MPLQVKVDPLNCRFCKAPLTVPFVDLGSAPPSNAYLTAQTLYAPETWYPLRVMVCTRCWLVQTEDFAAREAFFSSDYAYFSSMSSSWLAHAKAYVGKMSGMLALDASTKPEDMHLPGYRFHGLNTKPKRYAVDASGNYRITWAWDDGDAIDVDIEDYH